MKHKINKEKYGTIRKIAFGIAVAAGCSIDEVLIRSNSEYHVFMRVLLTKVAMEKGVNPYQVSLFLRKHHSTTLYYEDMYKILRDIPKFKELEQKYYEKYGN